MASRSPAPLPRHLVGGGLAILLVALLAEVAIARLVPLPAAIDWQLWLLVGAAVVFAIYSALQLRRG